MTSYVDDQSRPRAIHLFAGSGGGVLGGCLLGWRTVCAVEIDAFCREVLVSRQNDGTLDPFPIWDDVRTFDGRPWEGKCDVMCGGFPCQNISPLGNRAGIRGEKSCLWCEFARIVGEALPEYVFVENSSDLIKLGLDAVLRDLDSFGYDAEWECLSAAELGAPHIRDRVWVLAKLRGPEPAGDCGEAEGNLPDDFIGGECPFTSQELRILPNADPQRRAEFGDLVRIGKKVYPSELSLENVSGRNFRCDWWKAEPGVRRVADGVANGVDRLGSLGNGQVPYVAARAFCDLFRRFG